MALILKLGEYKLDQKRLEPTRRSNPKANGRWVNNNNELTLSLSGT